MRLVTLQPLPTLQPVFGNFMQFYIVTIIVKHMGYRSVNTMVLYFVLPQKHCNGGRIIVCTDRNTWLYLNNDKWLCLTDT
jgi:hypothetical protein